LDSEKRQLIFGVDTIEDVMANYEPNPMVLLYGRDHRGRTCGSCKHLESRGYTKRKYRCGLRPEFEGHKLRWNACAKIEGRG
jgi:hypothetical protein